MRELNSKLIIDCLYKIILFREPDISGLEGKSKIILELGVKEGFEKIVKDMYLSKEKSNQDFFQNYHIHDHELQDFYLFLDFVEGAFIDEFLSTEVSFLIGEIYFSLGLFEKASGFYNKLNHIQNHLIKKIYTIRHFQIESPKNINKEEIFEQKIKIKLALNDWFLDTFSEVEKNVNKNKDFKAAVANGLANSDMLADAIGEYLRVNFEDIPIDMAKSMVKQCCLLKGIDKDNTKVLIKGFNYIYNPPSFNENLIERKISKDIIVVGGFHFSGSSAVYDFLKSTGEISTVNIEAANYVNRIRKILKLENDKCSFNKGLVDYFLTNILNVYITGMVRGGKHKAHSLLPRALENTTLKMESFALAVHDFMATVTSTQGDLSKEALVSFLYRCCNVNSDTGRLALDQAPTAMELQNIINLPVASKHIAVFRDPRDLYVQQIHAKSIERGVYSDVYGFIEKFLKDRNNYFENRELLSDGYEFTDTTFEIFVRSENERKRIADFADVPFKEDKKHFDPSKSMKNIGIYKDYKDRKSIEIIEKELKDYLQHDL